MTQTEASLPGTSSRGRGGKKRIGKYEVPLSSSSPTVNRDMKLPKKPTGSLINLTTSYRDCANHCCPHVHSANGLLPPLVWNFLNDVSFKDLCYFKKGSGNFPNGLRFLFCCQHQAGVTLPPFTVGPSVSPPGHVAGTCTLSSESSAHRGTRVRTCVCRIPDGLRAIKLYRQLLFLLRVTSLLRAPFTVPL